MNTAAKIVDSLLETQERIIAAAIRFPDGEVFNDITHYGAVANAYNAGRFGEIPYEQLEDIYADRAGYEDGFLTNSGRYVDREEAAQIAIEANQASQGSSARSHGFLDSEDLRMGESVAVDLDGTLAKDSGWKGPEHIGEPVKPMLDLVKKLLDDGEEVVIFTARVHDGEKSTKDHIRDWLKDHDLPDLEITNEKRPDMEKFYDDKAVAVEKNKGVSESVSKRAFLVTYYPKRGYRPQTLVCIIDGDFTPAQVTKLIRQGAEQLAGRRLSWSREDLSIQMDSECDPEKARVAPGVPKVILNQDGSVQVLPA